MIEEFKQWWRKPYSDDMTAPEWFLFFGFVIVLSILWALVLREIRRIVEQ